MKKWLLLGLVLVALISGIAWGPVTHYYIAQETATRLRITDPALLAAFRAGAIMPDSYLAVYPWRIEQDMFHAEVYIKTMEALAKTLEERAFILGYRTHPIGDAIEGPYTTGKPDLGLAPEFIIDALVGQEYDLAGARIVASPAVQTLMIKAWYIAYPTHPWKPDIAFLNKAVSYFNTWLGLLTRDGVEIDPVAVRVYAGWEGYVQQSIDKSVETIKVAPTPTPTRRPQPTLRLPPNLPDWVKKYIQDRWPGVIK